MRGEFDLGAGDRNGVGGVGGVGGSEFVSWGRRS